MLLFCCFAPLNHASLSSPSTLAGNHSSITFGYAGERLGSVCNINFFEKMIGGSMGLLIQQQEYLGATPTTAM